MTAITERYLQDRIRELCDGLGLTVQHIERSDLAKAWLPGWPDLWIAGPHGILYRELKQQHEHLNPNQRKLGAIITAAGGDFGMWKPADLLSGRIPAELTAISRHGATNGTTIQR
jgi:hypothetical protein